MQISASNSYPSSYPTDLVSDLDERFSETLPDKSASSSDPLSMELMKEIWADPLPLQPRSLTGDFSDMPILLPTFSAKTSSATCAPEYSSSEVLSSGTVPNSDEKLDEDTAQLSPLLDPQSSTELATPVKKKGITPDFEREMVSLMESVLKQPQNRTVLIALAISSQWGRIFNIESFTTIKTILKIHELFNLTELHRLGVNYITGRGVEKNLVRAFICFSAGAELEDAKCLNSLGFYFYRGVFVTRDIPKAIKLFKKSADEGNPAALCNLGYCYLKHRIGLQRRYETAEILFLKAADKGYPPAMNRLGLIHLFGSTNHLGSSSTNRTEAFAWFERGAEKKDPSCMHNLASCYLFGIGVKMDFEKANELKAKVAELERAKQSQLGKDPNLLIPGICYRYKLADISIVNLIPTQSVYKRKKTTTATKNKKACPKVQTRIVT